MAREVDVVLGIIGGSGLYQMEGAEVVAEHRISALWPAVRCNCRDTLGRSHSVFLPPRTRSSPVAVGSAGTSQRLRIKDAGRYARAGRRCLRNYARRKIARAIWLCRTKFLIARAAASLDLFWRWDRGASTLRRSFLRGTARVAASRRGNGRYGARRGHLYMHGGPRFFHARPSLIFLSENGRRGGDWHDGLPEAKLACEAELCYAMLAMGTDYDCWHEGGRRYD